MSTTKNTSGYRKYLRMSSKSIQGRFVMLLSIVALAVGVLLAVNYWVIEARQVKQQALLEVWVPTHQSLKTLSIYLQTGFPEQKEALQTISTLNSLSEQWQNERIMISYERFLEQYEALQQLNEQESQLSSLPEYKKVEKTLDGLLLQTEQQLQALSQENAGFIGFLGKLFFWEYLGYVLMGFVLSTMMVVAVMAKIRKLKIMVAEIASGNLSQKLQVQNDEFHSISKSLNQLIDNLKDITNFSAEVGRGNMDASINAFDEKSELGRALSEMRDSLKKVAVEDKNRRWVNEGIAKFAQIVRLHNGHVDQLAEVVTGQLVKYVGALQGALFISRKTADGKAVLELSGCYAYDRQKFLKKQIPSDSGLIGQAYLEKAPKYLLEIPKNWDTITTGLGVGAPESILMMPLLHEDRVEGILELASTHKFEEYELEFLNKITETLGAAIAAVRINEETRLLLEESRGVTEELRSQEEEMRQNMEEMQATQEEMARAQKELLIKETNLNAFINNTTDSIITITRDYKVDLINEVLKNRYRGTPYEHLDKGSDILASLGSVAEEWKAYYDKSFAGESQNFTIKSSVQGEASWREYQLNPIKAKHGEVIGVSVVSRDTTEKVKYELQMKRKSAILGMVMEKTADAFMALDDKFRIMSFSKGIVHHIFEATPAVNSHFLQQLRPTHTNEWKEILTKVMAGETHTLSSLGGSDKPANLCICPVKGENEEVIAILISLNLQ